MKANQPVNDAVVLAAAVIETAISWYEGNSYAYWECQYCDSKVHERGAAAKDIDAATTALERVRRFPHKPTCAAKVAVRVRETPPMDLTQRQRELLDYLINAPDQRLTQAALGKALGKSAPAVCNLLAQLERKGYITRTANRRDIILRKVE